MAELIFRYDASSMANTDDGFQQVAGRVYYDGERRILADARSKVLIEKGTGGATCSITRLQSTSRLKYKRNWEHIRHDNVDVTVFWFVESGSVTFEQGAARRHVHSGQGVITRSSQPIHFDLNVDACAGDVLSLVVPTYLIQRDIADECCFAEPFAAREGDCRLAAQTIKMLFRDGGTASCAANDNLALQAAGIIGSQLARERVDQPSGLRGMRYLNALDFIRRNLSNPNLSAGAVASGVGVSYGYLQHLFKCNDTAFSSVVWESRIAMACEWLQSPAMLDKSIKQIAHMCGFKSAAHFNRMFKDKTGGTPGEFRTARSAGSPELLAANLPGNLLTAAITRHPAR